MHDVVPWLNTFLSELNLQQPLSKFKNHCIVYENKLTICIHNHIDIFCFFSSCVRLKTGRDFPVPTGTQFPYNKPIPFPQEKTGKNGRNGNGNRREVFPHRFRAYRIRSSNSRRLFPFYMDIFLILSLHNY